MSDDLRQALRAAADRSDAMLLHMTAARMRAAADRIDELEKELTDARALLETATDAWEDGGQLWPDDPRHGAYKCAALSRDWYAKARKAVEHE